MGNHKLYVTYTTNKLLITYSTSWVFTLKRSSKKSVNIIADHGPQKQGPVFMLTCTKSTENSTASAERPIIKALCCLHTTFVYRAPLFVILFFLIFLDPSFQKQQSQHLCNSKLKPDSGTPLSSPPISSWNSWLSLSIKTCSDTPDWMKNRNSCFQGMAQTGDFKSEYVWKS